MPEIKTTTTVTLTPDDIDMAITEWLEGQGYEVISPISLNIASRNMEGDYLSQLPPERYVKSATVKVKPIEGGG